jgi:hypothetical protein
VLSKIYFEDQKNNYYVTQLTVNGKAKTEQKFAEVLSIIFLVFKKICISADVPNDSGITF